MARRCPCGCGTRVRFTKSGAANGAQQAAFVVEFLHEVVEFVEREGATEAELAELRGSLARATQTQAWLLEHVHGTARPDLTPDLLQLHRGLKALQAMCEGIADDLDVVLSGSR